jgi:L-amino acid N-acyltransferase YncA
MRSRPAAPADAPTIARIYNDGIQDRNATFETRLRTPVDIERWLADGIPLVVVEGDAGDVLGWAAAHAYRPDRDAYAGVAECSVYVGREARGHGVGRLAMEALIAECERRGLWKLVSRIFPENTASLALCRVTGFREVGVYRRHGRLDGRWRDCVIVERLLGEAASAD